MTLTPRVLAARTAPSTSDFGAWSPPIASTAMVSMFGRATLARLRLLPGPCTARSAGTRGGATWAHGNSDTPTGRRPSAHRGRGGYWSASGSVYVSDSAYRYLNKISFARAFSIMESREFQIAERSPAIVGRLGFAIAHGLVPVLATGRANSLAVVTTDPLQRQGQQHLFPKDVLQFDAAAFVEADLSFAFVDLH